MFPLSPTSWAQFVLGCDSPGSAAPSPGIGIGRSLAAPPSHTTRHTGPYRAVRLKNRSVTCLAFSFASRCRSCSPFLKRRFRLHLTSAHEGQYLLAFLLLVSHKFRSLLASSFVPAFSVVSPPVSPARFLHLLCLLLTAAAASVLITPHLVGFRPRWAFSDQRQLSRGKLDYFQCTSAASTLCVLDGYGLRNLALARPTLTPLMRFLFIGSHLCSTLPSDLASRQRPCALLSFTSIRLARDFHPLVVEHARHTLFNTGPSGL